LASLCASAYGSCFSYCKKTVAEISLEFGPLLPPGAVAVPYLEVEEARDLADLFGRARPVRGWSDQPFHDPASLMTSE
jgi:hypothetical protein